MKICSSCGNTIPEQMSFCSACGTKYEAPSSSPTVCGACSAVNEYGSAFCKKCGKPLAGQPSQTVSKVSSSLTFFDFLALALGLFSVLFYEYYVGIAAGIAALVLGIKQLKTERKWLGIAGIFFGAIGILATIGVLLG